MGIRCPRLPPAAEKPSRQVSKRQLRHASAPRQLPCGEMREIATKRFPVSGWLVYARRDRSKKESVIESRPLRKGRTDGSSQVRDPASSPHRPNQETRWRRLVLSRHISDSVYRRQCVVSPLGFIAIHLVFHPGMPSGIDMRSILLLGIRVCQLPLYSRRRFRQFRQFRNFMVYLFELRGASRSRRLRPPISDPPPLASMFLPGFCLSRFSFRERGKLLYVSDHLFGRAP